jgi:hypothetical protein
MAPPEPHLAFLPSARRPRRPSPCKPCSRRSLGACVQTVVQSRFLAPRGFFALSLPDTTLSARLGSFNAQPTVHCHQLFRARLKPGLFLCRAPQRPPHRRRPFGFRGPGPPSGAQAMRAALHLPLRSHS